MLAVFCLRLALGMLAALLLLNPKVMHPRFFRTHFVIVLGLSVIAAVSDWNSNARIPLAVTAGLALIGSLVWIFEHPPAGWTLLILSAIGMMVDLAMLGTSMSSFGELVFDGGYTNIPLLRTTLAVRIASDLTAATLLGFSVTSMLVGHSYLISPGLSIKPLMRQLAALGIALILRTAVAGAALWFWSADHDITNLSDETVLWLPVRWLIGLIGPAVFGFMAYRTAGIKSTQSATGILYVVVILVFLGELTSLLLMRNTGLPL
jgi:hypothetical protein